MGDYNVSGLSHVPSRPHGVPVLGAGLTSDQLPTKKKEKEKEKEEHNKKGDEKKEKVGKEEKEKEACK